MRAFNASLFLFLFSMGFVFAADDTYRFESLKGGWRAMTEQADPFDSNKRKIIFIEKEGFNFVCGSLNMLADSDMYFDGFSFDAKIKYITDKNDAVDRIGKYATFLGGSDTVTDDRYYFFTLSNEDIETFRDSRILKVAGRTSSGWTTRAVDLRGFSAAYDAMCK